jgi:nucleotide-binding universal stress UspA family protein
MREQLVRVLGADHEVEIHLEAGSPHTEILRLAEQIEPCLIVVGGSSDRVGRVAEHVVRSSPGPVLVALRYSGKAVLAATDFSDPALPAVHAAMDEARRRRKPCYVLHSVDFMTIPASPEIVWSDVARQTMEALRAEGRAKLDEIGMQLGKKVRTVLSEGTASEAIPRKADELDVDLIVVGTHGRSGLPRLVLGSVAETVVRGSRRSILVVRLA